MQRQSEISLKDAIEKMLQDYKLKGKVYEVRLVQNWESIMGSMIAKHTKELYLKNKTLHLKLDSPMLKQELAYATTKIIGKANEALGARVIENIVFL